MKTGIKKPILIFLLIIFILSGLIIVIRGIQIPAVSFLQSKKTPEIKTVQKSNFKVQSNKLIIKYSDFDLFLNECCSSIIKDTTSKKDGNSVKISGKATFPFPANFEAKLTPFVENQKINVKISDVILGKIESPEMLNEKLSSLIEKGLDEKINKQYKVKDAKITGEGLELTIN